MLYCFKLVEKSDDEDLKIQNNINPFKSLVNNILLLTYSLFLARQLSTNHLEKLTLNTSLQIDSEFFNLDYGERWQVI